VKAGASIGEPDLHRAQAEQIGDLSAGLATIRLERERERATNDAQVWSDGDRRA
jgi:hypothetical protein